jgi:DNA gyrase subunit B
MTRELLTRGLNDTKLILLATPDRPAEVVFEGERLTQLVKVLSELEDPLLILERRSLSLPSMLARGKDGAIPMYRALLGGKEHWFTTAEELDRFRQAEQARLGRDLVVGDEAPPIEPAPSTNGSESASFIVQELHEVRGLNRGLGRLKEFGMTAADLMPALRIAGREPPPRYSLIHDEVGHDLPHLRDLPGEIRKLGEKGLTVTRFKGLGEMNPDQLWETTLDPKNRILLQVQLEDALKADEMFRTLMGEKVEPRREFIQKHALEVKDIDYHGA